MQCNMHELVTGLQVLSAKAHVQTAMSDITSCNGSKTCIARPLHIDVFMIH